jgi:hypothetical protein
MQNARVNLAFQNFRMTFVFQLSIPNFWNANLAMAFQLGILNFWNANLAMAFQHGISKFCLKKLTKARELKSQGYKCISYQ